MAAKRLLLADEIAPTRSRWQPRLHVALIREPILAVAQRGDGQRVHYRCALPGTVTTDEQQFFLPIAEGRSAFSTALPFEADECVLTSRRRV